MSVSEVHKKRESGIWPIQLLLIASLVSGMPAVAAETTPADVPGPSFRDVLSLRGVSSPRISPDGRSVVFQLGTTDWEENRYDSEIWLARDGEEPFALTASAEVSSGSPRFSPDGRFLGFLAERDDEGRQLYVIRPDGGEARRVTTHEGGIRSFRWSSDGARIAFSATDERSDELEEREERYGEFAIEDHDLLHTHLWIVGVDLEDPFAEPAEAKRLTAGDTFSVGSFELSPDGRAIAFDHRPRPLVDDFVRSDLSIVKVEGGPVRPLVTGSDPEAGPLFSPDGRWVVFSSPAGANPYYGNTRLLRVPAAGGEPEVLTGEFDEDTRAVAWRREGIFFLASQRTERHLFRLDPGSGEIERKVLDVPLIWSVDFADDGRFTLAGESPTRLGEIYRGNLGGAALEPITQMTDQVAGWRLGSREVIRWRSRDDTEIEGVLYLPEDHDPSRPAPLLVVIHGGPTGTSRPVLVSSYVYPIAQWLAKGALVLMPNYRGSAGYGEAFRALNVRNLGVGDAWDVISGVDHLVERGLADPERLGAMGWSQGGYISAFLSTTSDRFRAISDGAGISDWMTYYVNTDIHGFTRQYLEATPWDDPEVYAKTSPMTYIKGAKTPTLIQHGEFDRRVPVPNAYQLYQGLQDMGVDTRLIIYKGFGHGISKPKERLAAVWHNWQWFAKYLWGEEVELPLADDDADDDEDETMAAEEPTEKSAASGGDRR